MKDAVIILCGGGPAPGMNSVSMSVAKTFLSKGYRVIGLHGGYSGLFSKNARTEDLDFFIADRFWNRGGSYLEMSRFKPTDKDFEENFNLVYDNFTQKLMEQFPDLKKNDLKLCVYLRMGLSSKEMASLLNTSVRSIETARYRLRKKLNIGSGDNLLEFISEIDKK